MKRSSLHFVPILCVLAAMLPTACKSDDTPSQRATLTLEVPDCGTNPTLMQIGTGDCTVALQLLTTGEWRIETLPADDWLTLTPSSGRGNAEVTLTATANAQAAARQAEVRFYLGKQAVHTLSVEQAAGEAYLTVTPDSGRIPIGGGDLTLTVATNAGAWSAAVTDPEGSPCSWLTQQQAEGSLTLTAAKNSDATKRQALVTLSVAGHPDLTRTVTVTQGTATADLLDVVFHNDGTAADRSASHRVVQRHSGSGLLTYYNDSYGDYVARFNHDPGSSPAAGYYKVDYAADAAFREALADGHTLEVLVMFDAEADGSSEIKPFSSMQSGGTGFLITTRDRGTKLTFLPNLAPDGWRWTCSDVTPARGTYYHLVGVYDQEAGKSRIYVNGELQSEINVWGTFQLPASGSNWFCIGGDASSNGAESAWRGDIALARIYDEPLPGDIVADLWAGVKGRMPQASPIRLSDIFFLPRTGVQPGSAFKVFGSGFAAGDRVRLESVEEETRTYLCDAAATDASIAVTIPEGFVSGSYRMVLLRGEAQCPIGMIELTLSDNPTTLDHLPQVVAHRGFHTTNGAAENSLASLTAAIELGVYGSEADFYITTDGVVVSNHDTTIDGILIENATFDQIKDIRLSNGETVATLDTYLDRLGETGTKLVVEIKQHATAENNRRVVDAIVEELQRRQMVGRCDFISFGYDICQRLAAEPPEAMVGYLMGDMAPSALDPAIRCIDYQMTVLKNNPQWVTEAHDRGMKVNVWTVNSEADMMEFIAMGVDFITTDHPDTLQKILARLTD